MKEVEVLTPEAEPIFRKRGKTAVEKKKAAEIELKAEDSLRELQDEVFKGGLVTVRDMLNFREINPGQEMLEDPIYQKWAEEFGEEEAAKRYRVAAASWAPDKETPMAIKQAAQLTVGIMKARAVEKGGTRVLNVGTVNMTADIPKLPEVEVE